MQQVLFVRHISQTLVFSGTPVTGLLTALRTDTGVVESFDALITTGRAVDDGVRQTAIERAVTLNSMDFSMEHHFGADAMGVQSGADQFRVPLATVLGPDLLRQAAFQEQGPASVQGVPVQ